MNTKHVNIYELVNLFGNEKQQNHVKKYGKFKSKDIREAVFTTAKVKYNDVKHLGRGKGFLLIGKKDKNISRKSLLHYENCGNKEQCPYKKDLRTLLLQYLVNHRHSTITLKTLAHEMGVISREMQKNSSIFGTEERQEYFRILCKENSRFSENDYALYWECILKETKRITDELDRILKQLNEEGIVKYDSCYIGVNSDKEYDEIDESLVPIIHQKQIELQSKYEVTPQDVIFNLSKDNVKSYNREYYSYLRELGYDRIYQAKKINLLFTKELLQEDLNKTIPLYIIKNTIIEFASQKAKNRENTFHEKNVVPRVNHRLYKQFGGVLKKEYYKLLPEGFNTPAENIFGYEGLNILTNDTIISLKYSRLYADEYKEKITYLLK
ncbi:hypothetical protein [Rummeliibacillus suwonensis]|uniref:hypothetical protein n=1 Tax=Rummeliibacillus suwonensis TaxID=1306154 RepID=UPI001AAEDFCA|nr:hypothetical protein [Rummeliibacillus suwonensis]MBO2535089.1 hypothetical protein [Rummeliibacillus suwonensis]